MVVSSLHPDGLVHWGSECVSDPGQLSICSSFTHESSPHTGATDRSGDVPTGLSVLTPALCPSCGHMRGSAESVCLSAAQDWRSLSTTSSPFLSTGTVAHRLPRG